MPMIWGRRQAIFRKAEPAPTATEWHDGQFAHGTHARIARRAPFTASGIPSQTPKRVPVRPKHSVRRGLVPRVHVFLCKHDVDGRDEPGHDEPNESFRAGCAGCGADVRALPAGGLQHLDSVRISLLWIERNGATGCPDKYIDLKAGVPQIAAELLQRPSRQPWANKATLDDVKC